MTTTLSTSERTSPFQHLRFIVLLSHMGEGVIKWQMYWWSEMSIGRSIGRWWCRSVQPVGSATGSFPTAGNCGKEFYCWQCKLRTQISEAASPKLMPLEPSVAPEEQLCIRYRGAELKFPIGVDMDAVCDPAFPSVAMIDLSKVRKAEKEYLYHCGSSRSGEYDSIAAKLPQNKHNHQWWGLLWTPPQMSVKGCGC